MAERALLFTDLVDSTQLAAQLGDEAIATAMADHDHRARALLAVHRGFEVDHTDGFFLLFDAVIDAARYALDYQDALSALGLAARVGLHVGTVTLRDNPSDLVARGAKRTEVDGVAKPLAARIMTLAGRGQTLLSAAARVALGSALDGVATFSDHGHYQLKGVEAPIGIFEVGRLDVPAFAPPGDAEKAYRVVRHGDFWRPLREVRNNLPAERDAFVGRGADLRAVADTLDAGQRLVTLLGPGGTGKTRLAVRYGRAWLGDWPGGVYFCDLSEARSEDGIHFAVAGALEVALGQGDAARQLGHAIAGRGRCLLILDNFEQVLEHAPATLGRWIERAEAAVFLVTSRERLRLVGEAILPIDPLPLAREAVELFALRARAQRPDFAVTEVNRDAVERIVTLLDGLPLAIELAAARARLLSPKQIVERLRERFQLLAGARGAAMRQATLRAAIDWSWDLLTPWEQAAFAQCSVFDGGFTLEASEAVLDLSLWPDAPPAMDAVQALVDKSLLRVWVPAQEGRHGFDEPYFGMYLSIHEYAAEKLATIRPGARTAAEARHGRHFALFGSDAALEALRGHDGVARRRALTLEFDNLVAACRRAVERHDADSATGSFLAAWEVIELRGPLALGVSLGTQVLGIDGMMGAQRAAAELTNAVALWRSGRAEEARSGFERALEVARGLNDSRREGIVLGFWGDFLRERGQSDEARIRLEAALAIHRERGNRRGEAAALSNLGVLHHEQGRLEDARRYYEAARAIHVALGDRRSEGILLGNLGVLHSAEGDLDSAGAHYAAAAEIAREVGNRRVEGVILANLGILLHQQGRFEEALAPQEKALTIARDVGNRRSQGVVLGNLGRLRHVLGQIVEARRDCEAALPIVVELGSTHDEAHVLANLAMLDQEEGHIAEAQKRFEAALAKHRQVGNRSAEGDILARLAGMLIDQGGDAATASALLDDAERILRDVGEPMMLGAMLCVRGRAAVASNDRERALQTLAEAEEIAAMLAMREGSELSAGIAQLRREIASAGQSDG